MNVSDITQNKPSLSYEHLKYDLVSWIILESPEKSPQLINHLYSMSPNRNTQLKIRKWCVPLRSALYLLSFWSDLCQYLSIFSTIWTTDKTLKDTVHSFTTIMLHPSIALVSNVRLKGVSKVYHVLYNNRAGVNTMPKCQLTKECRRKVQALLYHVNATTYNQINFS